MPLQGRRGRGKAPRAGLPEPPAGRWRRIWGNRLDGALGWAESLHMVIMPLVLVLLFLPTAVIAIDFLTGHKLIPEEHILTIFLIKYGVLSTLTVLALTAVEEIADAADAGGPVSVDYLDRLVIAGMGAAKAAILRDPLLFPPKQTRPSFFPHDLASRLSS